MCLPEIFKVQNTKFRVSNNVAPCVVENYFELFSFILQKPSDIQTFLGAGDRLIRNANLQYRLTHAKDVAVKQFEVSLSRQLENYEI